MASVANSCHSQAPFLGNVQLVLLGHFYYLEQCVIHTKIKVLVDSEFPAKLELKAS